MLFEISKFQNPFSENEFLSFIGRVLGALNCVTVTKSWYNSFINFKFKLWHSCKSCHDYRIMSRF